LIWFTPEKNLQRARDREMDLMGNVLIIDGDEARRQQLETLLHSWAVSAKARREDCLAYLDAAQVSACCCAIWRARRSHALLARFARVPFIICQPGEPSQRNLIGILEPPTVMTTDPLLHFCQSFQCQHPALPGIEHSQTLLRLLVGKAMPSRVCVC
jgi:hypothetical protein